MTGARPADVRPFKLIFAIGPGVYHKNPVGDCQPFSYKICNRFHIIWVLTRIGNLCYK